MNIKYTPEDVQDLRLTGTPSKNLQATWEFCDVLNTLSDRLGKWRERYEHLGSAEANSVKSQVKVIAQVTNS
jgi:hypothetical protein